MRRIQTLRDFYNRIIGYIETDEVGNKVARDAYHRILGKYDAKQDLTRDFYNRVVGRGDLTAALIQKK